MLIFFLCYRMENSVLILGDSHLKRMAQNFEFPPAFTVIGVSGAKVQMWEEFKDEIRGHHILVVVLGGNNVTAKPSDPQQNKESLSQTMTSFDELRNFCNFASTSLIICQVFNRKCSMKSNFDPIEKLNGRLRNKKLKPNFRSFNFDPVLSEDGVHLTPESYKAACGEILTSVQGPPLARPEFAKLNVNNVV